MRVIPVAAAVVLLMCAFMGTLEAGDAEAEVKAVMDDYRTAMLTGEVASLLDLYSENWSDLHGSTKEDLKEGYEGTAEKGPAKGLEVDLSGIEVAIDGDVATVSPVTLSAPQGSITYTHTLQKEADGAWRFIRTVTLSWESFEMDAEERKLKAEHDAAAMAARDLRERLLSDPHRPGYHFVMPEGIATPFDPNGAIYWKGRYHLFYIFQDDRSGIKMDHWGHISSTDLFHWRHHPTDLLDGMYSGNCFVNSDGVPTICYHQRGQGNAMAVALDDELNEWKKLDTNPITPDTREGDEHHGKYKSWDPHGWLEGDTYYAIFGGQRPGVVKSPALGGEWRYVGDLFAHGVEGVSLDEDVSCADLFELGGKDVLLAISHQLGCRYYVGEWKDEQFYPESHAQMSWVDHSFFAPESLVDDQGRRIMWAWILDAPEFGVRWDYGWSGTMSLPRVLSLGDDGLLRMDVPEEIEALRYDAVKKKDLTVPSGTEVPIEGIGGDSFELFIEMESAEASEFGVKVRVSPDGQEETSIFYDASEGKLKVDTRKSGPEHASKALEAAPFELKEGERLELRVFVDKSVVEVFANGRQAIARRIYPSRADSMGVSLFSTGGEANVHAIKAWKIMPSNPY
jgi:beta-fructofuranosidase